MENYHPVAHRRCIYFLPPINIFICCNELVVYNINDEFNKYNMI